MSEFNKKGQILYSAMQYIDKDFIAEAASIEKKNKKCRFVMSEKFMDNLAAVAIVCVVVATILLVPRILKNLPNDVLAPGNTETVSKTEGESESVILSGDEDGIFKSKPGDIILNNVLYTKGLLNVIVGDMIPDNNTESDELVKSPDGFSVAADMQRALGNIGSDKLYVTNPLCYTVEFHTYKDLPVKDGMTQAEALMKLIMDEGGHAVHIRPKGIYKSDYGDFYIEHKEDFVYGSVTYEEMKELAYKLARKDPGNGICYSLLSLFEVQNKNMYTKNMNTGDLNPFYSDEELNTTFKYVYSKLNGTYVVSWSQLKNDSWRSDGVKIPDADNRVTYSNVLRNAIDYNPVINTDNFNDMTYLVRVDVYSLQEDNKQSQGSHLVDAKTLEQEYKRLKNIYGDSILLKKRYWYEPSGGSYAIYGMLTYEQMKNMQNNSAFGYGFSIAFEEDLGPRGVIEKELYGSDYTIIKYQ